MSNPTFSPDQINQIIAIDKITSQNQAAVASGSAPATTTTSQSSAIFSKNSLVLLVSIMVIYAILYSLFRLFLGERMSIGYKGIFIDILAVIFVLYLIVNYNSNYFSTDASTDPVGGFLVWMRNYADNLSNIFLTVLLIIFFYLFLYVLQVPMEPEERPYSLVIINGLVWAFFFLQLFNVLCMVMFGFSVADAMLDPFIQGWYSLPGANSKGSTPPPYKNAQTTNQMIIQDPSGFMTWLKNGGLDDMKGGTNLSNMVPTTSPVQLSLPQNYYNCKSTPGPSVDDGAEVFNIANNLYTYDDADAICQAFGARLATYDEVEAAYNDGGEWCNYGWSADQMALFPTQKETWNRLQKTATHKHDCGRPGVNGGYMDNPNLKFGVNCYGMKPGYQADKDISGIKISTTTKSISNPNQARIDYWKQHMDQLQLNSFNFSNWTEYWLPQEGAQPAPQQPVAPQQPATGGPTGSGSVIPTVLPQQTNTATTRPSG